MSVARDRPGRAGVRPRRARQRGGPAAAGGARAEHPGAPSAAEAGGVCCSTWCASRWCSCSSSAPWSTSRSATSSEALILGASVLLVRGDQPAPGGKDRARASGAEGPLHARRPSVRRDGRAQRIRASGDRPRRRAPPPGGRPGGGGRGGGLGQRAQGDESLLTGESVAGPEARRAQPRSRWSRQERAATPFVYASTLVVAGRAEAVVRRHRGPHRGRPHRSRAGDGLRRREPAEAPAVRAGPGGGVRRGGLLRGGAPHLRARPRPTGRAASSPASPSPSRYCRRSSRSW